MGPRRTARAARAARERNTRGASVGAPRARRLGAPARWRTPRARASSRTRDASRRGSRARARCVSPTPAGRTRRGGRPRRRCRAWARGRSRRGKPRRRLPPPRRPRRWRAPRGGRRRTRRTGDARRACGGRTVRGGSGERWAWWRNPRYARGGSIGQRQKTNGGPTEGVPLDEGLDRRHVRRPGRTDRARRSRHGCRRPSASVPHPGRAWH